MWQVTARSSVGSYVVAGQGWTTKTPDWEREAPCGDGPRGLRNKLVPGGTFIPVGSSPSFSEVVDNQNQRVNYPIWSHKDEDGHQPWWPQAYCAEAFPKCRWF